MSDGTLSIRRRQPKASQAASEPLTLDSLRHGMFDNLLGSNFKSIGSGRFKEKGKGKAKPIGDADELKIESRRQRKLRDYDKLLKSFKYSAALDTVLRKVILRFQV